MKSSGSARAASRSSGVMKPDGQHAVEDVALPIDGGLGRRSGWYRLGACGRPASSAAWASDSSPTSSPKNVCAAAEIP